MSRNKSQPFDSHHEIVSVYIEIVINPDIKGFFQILLMLNYVFYIVFAFDDCSASILIMNEFNAFFTLRSRDIILQNYNICQIYSNVRKSIF